ncbi:serpin B5 [Spea bombifrons]|uniref:serpin B5 n=1 Tax=Spea bombifrons TaxID=233779 RepID=UPI002349E2EB|nr:serpin B5 [Spea bombifrons]
MDALRLANTALAVDVFKNLCEKNKTDNIIFSPICISTSLALAHKGSKGNTASELEKVLHLEKVKDRDFGFQSLASDISKISSIYSLKLVKRLYVEKSIDCTKDFINSAKKPYPLELEPIDIKSQAGEARNQINSSVKDLTDGKIENILGEDACDENTRMLMVGAAYFKGSWLYKFNESETKEVEFHINKNETRPVQMMYLEARLSIGYINDLKTMILELPFTSKHLSLLILLPKKIEDDSTGLEKLEQDLTYEKYVHWTNPSMMANSKVKLCLPKFKLESTYDLKDTLKSLGLNDAFNEEVADFSGMSESKSISVSQAIHKACIEVDEDGSEIADVTKERLLMHKEEFFVDHPFLFILRHNKTRTILMYGRYCCPTAAS